MGAEQSSTRAGGQAPVAVRKTCYYELLGVERLATDEEIRRAYKRKALELHPDRNLGDTENATKKFAEVQTAYEILSDPQERAWYDSHRDAILRGEDEYDQAGDGGHADQYYENVRVTTTDELFALMGRFNSSVPFDDSPKGFFTILNTTFAQLAREEEAACRWDGLPFPPPYPEFGSAKDDYDSVAKPFYNIWSSFSTKKSFSWKDKYRLSDAPDRTIRRLMEKENRKLRELAARDFNDAVRSLVAFVKKRDPRYVPNTQSEAERQKILRDSAAAQAARSRAANQEKLAAAAGYVAPEWARSGNGGDSGLEGEFSASSDAESEVQEQIECVVCNKTFKSDKQFEAHEKSKKHVKAVQQLRRQMKKENKDLDLDQAAETEPEEAQREEEDDEEEKKEEDPAPNGKLASELNVVEPDADSHSSPKSPAPESGLDSDADSDDDYAPRDVLEDRLLRGRKEQTNPLQRNGSNDEVDGEMASEMRDVSLGQSAGEKKIGKAKAKREKKAAREAAALEQQANQIKCAVCQETFDSRTKLHKHLQVSKHAAPVPASTSSKASKKKKR